MLVDLLKDSKAIGCRWVFHKKDNEQHNSSLVAKGYAQKKGIDYNETFLFVVKHTSIRMLLAIIAQFDLELKQMDVKTTFLHGELEEKIYMKQHEGYIQEDKENKVCLLKKSLYGLKQPPGSGINGSTLSRSRPNTTDVSIIVVSISSRVMIRRICCYIWIIY